MRPRGLISVLQITVILLALFGLGWGGLLIAQAQSPEVQNVELVGHIGGRIEAVFVQGDYAYIGEGPKLTILDITNPVTPVVVGKTLPQPGQNRVRDLYVSGPYAYLAAGDDGLRVIDVTAMR